MFATPFSTVLSVVSSNLTWNTFYDPQFVVLNLILLCVQFMYICKVPLDIRVIPNTGIVKKKESFISLFNKGLADRQLTSL